MFHISDFFYKILKSLFIFLLYELCCRTKCGHVVLVYLLWGNSFWDYASLGSEISAYVSPTQTEM